VKVKPRGKSTTTRPKALPGKFSELRGWPAIAQFLGLPNSTVHRWAKEGMPVRREGRNVVASSEELDQWLQSTSGEAAGVRVITPGSDLLKDLRASVAAQKETENSPSSNGQLSLEIKRKS
jgi:predicted DNA-binding transcriptional regulator AlpA